MLGNVGPIVENAIQTLKNCQMPLLAFEKLSQIWLKRGGDLAMLFLGMPSS